jgi:hypothetical protein
MFEPRETAAPQLGLGILLAASLSTMALRRLLNCDTVAADNFKARAMADLINLQAQINRARNGLSQ